MMGAYGITIKSNAVTHQSTWIPLDAVACLERREEADSLLKPILFAVAVYFGIYTFAQPVYGFILEHTAGTQLRQEIILYVGIISEIINKFKADEVGRLVLIGNGLPIVLLLSLLFWRMRLHIEIVSNSGNRIRVTFVEMPFFANSRYFVTNRLFEEILKERDEYLKSINKNEDAIIS
jgi:hypothetical protein